MKRGGLVMRFNLQKVRADVQEASIEDLLDRATVWRDGMEPEALELIEAELQRQGIQPSDLEEHAARRAKEVMTDREGLAAVCYRCGRPASEKRWVWGRFWKILPLFPRRAYVCEEHRPSRSAISASQSDRHPPE
jgi:ATP-dependent helicase YprA (DUF1998 family)